MKIHVMGPGCAKCEEAEKTVREAVAEAGVDAEIIKVDSKSGEISLVSFVDSSDQLLGLNSLIGGIEFNGGAMCIVRADVKSVFAQ